MTSALRRLAGRRAVAMLARMIARTLLLALALAACDGASDAPTDAGFDATVALDSATDSAIDSAVDSGADGGLERDAGPETDGGAVTDAGPPTELTFRVVDAQLPEGAGVARGLELFTSEAALAAYFGGVAPAGVDFSREHALLYTEGDKPFPGHLATVTGLALSADGTELLVDTAHREPGASCETLGLRRVAFQLVAFEAAPTAATERAHASSTFDCATTGGAEHAACSEAMLCGAGLICGNLTRGDAGLCYPAALWDTFTDPTEGALTDDGVTTRTLMASGLATVDVDVIAYVELTHADPSELRITLTNPSGNEVVVFDREPVASPVRLARVPVGFSGDEDVNGEWTLRVTDHVPGNTGTLTRWSVEIVSRWD